MISTRVIRPLLAAAALSFAGAASATPGLTERIVADPANGIALYGYDPVAYFTAGRATLGRRDLEAEWGGTAWRFSSAANRAAFLSAPEVYAPRFGGYDPVALTRGAAAAGHPLVFRVFGDRLYLFLSEKERDAFGDPRGADASWPKVSATLAN